MKIENGSAIRARVVPCALGFLLVVRSDKGLRAVRLGDLESELQTQLTKEFASATLCDDDAQLNTDIAQLLRHLDGEDRVLDLVLDVSGTPFQRDVWRALQQIPFGETRSYTQIAQAVGKPQAVRAVGGACAANGVALVVPCHRVLRADGSLNGFRWSTSRKAQLLRREQQQLSLLD